MPFPERTLAFYYQDYAAFLSDYVARKKQATPSYSYKALCRAAGLKSQSLVAMVAKGQRLPTPTVLRRLNTAMKLSPGEAEFLETLVGFKRAKDARDRDFFAGRLKAQLLEAEVHPIAVDQFAFIADWYHVAILEMLSLKDFCEEPEWISARLGGKASPDEIATALARLLRLQLIGRGPDGRLRTASPNFVTEVTAPSDAIAHFHRQMLDHALQAFRTHRAEERAMIGVTMNIDRSRRAEALQAIAEFRMRFLSQFASEQGDDTCQLNIQFHRLTESLQSHPAHDSL